VTDDDKDLFRQALADAKPLRTTRRAAEVIRKPAPRARFARADEMAALRESLEADIDDTESHGGESLRFHRPSVGKRTLRKLARGSFSV
jgi:DNA-nicking Smr family endonuclease